jgi:membrane-bound metal-dependent hydrolase YbcI (DUF457 family)
MASIGHVVLGMTAARLVDRARVATVVSLAFWSAVSLLPDVDVIGFSFGVAYADPWGHRGATHSFAIAAVVGVAGALVARRFGKPLLRTGITIALVLASHAVLDTMTAISPMTDSRSGSVETSSHTEAIQSAMRHAAVILAMHRGGGSRLCRPVRHGHIRW